MHRIAALPRRCWRDLEAETVPLLTAALRTRCGQQCLRALQAVGIREAAELGGAYIMGRVGIGKTLITLLVGEFMREERVLILVPGGDKAKTEREFDEYRKHWHGITPDRYKLLGYSDVSGFPKLGMSIQKLWGGLGPTLIVCDEADRLRRVDVNKGASGLALQIQDYLAVNPTCKLIALTGTPEKESIKDYAHILLWCLGERSPLPTDPDELQDWSDVIDRGDMRCAKKVVLQLGGEWLDGLTVEDIRAMYQDRLRATPGVIISDDQFDGPLEFRSIIVEPDGMDPHFVKLRRLWQRPDGWDLTPDEPSDDEDRRPDRVTNGSIWACARQMSLGFCYIADPVPPEDWMQCRREYFQAVRSAIRERQFYTENQFRQAAAKGELPRPKWQRAYQAWEEMRPSFTPGSKPLWLSNHALQFCQDWGEEAPGIIWVDHTSFGLKLAELTGWRFHQGGGKDSRGKRIDQLFKVGTHATETVIASRFACGTGKNLQPWNRHLVTAMPANNRDFEQMVGRSHRELQDRPVRVDIMVGCLEHAESIEKVLDGATRTSQNLFNQKASTFTWHHVDQLPKGIAYND